MLTTLDKVEEGHVQKCLFCVVSNGEASEDEDIWRVYLWLGVSVQLHVCPDHIQSFKSVVVVVLIL